MGQKLAFSHSLARAAREEENPASIIFSLRRSGWSLIGKLSPLIAEYIEITRDSAFEHFASDPWAQPVEVDIEAQRERLLAEFGSHKILIIGAGFGGLLFAVRSIQTGRFTAEDITIIDSAAGFGGTWYWNRYPGLMCDTESYIYMPLLEETGYMPRNKYASGNEIREHAERIAQTYGLATRVMFRTVVEKLDWNEAEKVWTVTGSMLGVANNGQTDNTMSFQMVSQFTIMASGSFASPRVPDYPNIFDYKGKLFHTARWDYNYTGGSVENPKMLGLADKTVAIIGTGASAVQIVPQLAKYSNKLIVFQRTPAGVDARNNCPTDPVWWETETQAEGTGWQKRRQANFNAFTCNEKPLPSVNKVDDGWTRMPSFSILIGGPQGLDPDYVDRMRAVDMNRQEKIRARAHNIVQSEDSADLLTPWYPGWCKRPCFHDDYLSAFNLPNVELVDIRHSGISHFTANGLVANDVEYELDAIILSTGYTVPVTRVSPSSRANIAVSGRNGTTMEAKWANGLATLHGVMTRDLPNLFFAGTSQAGACVNLVYSLDQNATHVAYILANAFDRRPSDSARVIIEPTAEAEEAWAMQVLQRAAGFRGIAGCTPGYLNGYGMDASSLSPEQQINAARLAAWGEGIASYGDLNGIELTFFAEFWSKKENLVTELSEYQ
ncbi:hypothetical protein BDV09DRAFT_204761 [Aspergillus tetrazonus]